MIKYTYEIVYIIFNKDETMCVCFDQCNREFSLTDDPNEALTFHTEPPSENLIKDIKKEVVGEIHVSKVKISHTTLVEKGRKRE